ncbi:unnamed protein product [Oikopleura dioica]|uniref:Uncharacterized protein n=1 Tax=Oikopleura dioica TaxID=34765 RepID=E4WXG6_OIKDI|nr:unnamed protein product [Oikopleura dioica]CBY35744.1 unnamed protein product [Oikopleura dioica]
MSNCKFIAMTSGKCPGIWSFSEFQMQIMMEEDEEDMGQWKYFKTREEAREHLYKHKIPALYEDGEPIEAYPLNRFAEPQKGLPTDTFYEGRDERTWILDDEGSHVVYCSIIKKDEEYGLGLHWGNDIEISLPIHSIHANRCMDALIAEVIGVEGALRDSLRLGKNRVCVRCDSEHAVEKLNKELKLGVQFTGELGNFRNGNFGRKVAPEWYQVLKLANALMSLKIERVENTDKNYHRARKLAHEGRQMMKVSLAKVHKTQSRNQNKPNMGKNKNRNNNK